MSQLSALKTSATLSDVAKLLGYKPSGLSYLLYKKPMAIKYKSFDIPKRSGGSRNISAPAEDLKLIQKRLANLLQNCLNEINANNNTLSTKSDRVSHGFMPKRSIYSNASQHKNRRHVFNIDISDFFGSINFGRVRGFFISDKNFLLSPKVATIIAQIACFDNKLPQGSPCSPIISNLIAHILDIHLIKLSSRLGCTYSRYADDLTFSTNKEIFPSEIAHPTALAPHNWTPGGELRHIVSMSGFKINASKTRMQYRDSRQEVMGLIVNKKVNIRSEYRHNIRAMVHSLITTGQFSFEKIDKPSQFENSDQHAMNLMKLHGSLGFIEWIDRKNRGLLNGNKNQLNGTELIFRRFLMYKEFYAAPTPVLICEGKTDNVYITHAIRGLANSYPDLATTDSDGKITIKIRRFRYTEKSTGRILGINGGFGDFKHLLLLYHKESMKFKAPGMQSPVIILIDDDDAAGQILSAASQITRKAVDKTKAFTHVTKNLYLIVIPDLQKKGCSTIEDLFDKETRNMKIGNKTLSTSKEANRELHYSKADFAYKIVKAHAERIDFSGFTPLLDRISDVIKFHKTHLIPDSETA